MYELVSYMCDGNRFPFLAAAILDIWALLRLDWFQTFTIIYHSIPTDVLDTFKFKHHIIMRDDTCCFIIHTAKAAINSSLAHYEFYTRKQ